MCFGYQGRWPGTVGSALHQKLHEPTSSSKSAFYRHCFTNCCRSLTPNSHSYNYRSAVLQGYARPVDDVNEKMYAMQAITNKVVPQRWQNTRTPPDNVEMTSTMVLKVKIETGSGKIRHGEPHDEAKDLNREDITSSVWTGVIPVQQTLLDPVPSATNKVMDVPSYISSYVSDTNASNKQQALDAMKE